MELRKSTLDRAKRGAAGKQPVSAIQLTINGDDDGPEIRAASGVWNEDTLALNKRKKKGTHVALQGDEFSRNAMWDVRRAALRKAVKNGALVVLRLKSGDFDLEQVKSSEDVVFVQEGRQEGFLVAVMRVGGTITIIDSNNTTHCVALGKDRKLVHKKVGPVTYFKPKEKEVEPA